MYSVLSDDEDDDDKVVDEDEAFIHPPVDDKIGNAGAQTNRANGKATPTGEKWSSEVQQSVEKDNNNEENDAILNLCGGNDDDNSARQSRAKIGARKRKAKSLRRVRSLTLQSPKSLTAMNAPRVQHKEDLQPRRVKMKAKHRNDPSRRPASRERKQVTGPRLKIRKRHQESKPESREPTHTRLPRAPPR